MSATLQNFEILFLEKMFISGQSRWAEMTRNEKKNLMVQSDSTRCERIFQEKNVKILKRCTHIWIQSENVPVIPRP